MPTFNYTARDKGGTLQSGHLDAVGEEEVLTILQARGFIVTGLSRRDLQLAQTAQQRAKRRMRGGVAIEDKVMFARQLATLIEASIPLLRSLQVVSAQIESRPLYVAVEQVRQDIEGGKTFRDALAKHPKIFSSFWVNLVGTGEAGGHLGQSLAQLADYVESMRVLQSKAVTAMTYPMVLVGASCLAVVVFLVKIIPIFIGVFASMNIELPLLTQIIVNISILVRKYAIVLLLGAFTVSWLVKQFVQSEQGHWLIDRALLRLPVFNQLFIQLQLSQFARGLGTLLQSGVPILYSLEIMEHGASNRVYGKAIGEVKEFVREGKTMAEPMEQTGLFPPMVIQMLQVGEEIGQLDKMLSRVATYYEARVTTFIERLSSLFEPLAIGVMAVVIGTLVMAMFMPIFKLAGSAH